MMQIKIQKRENNSLYSCVLEKSSFYRNYNNYFLVLVPEAGKKDITRFPYYLFIIIIKCIEIYYKSSSESMLVERLVVSQTLPEKWR